MQTLVCISLIASALIIVHWLFIKPSKYIHEDKLTDNPCAKCREDICSKDCKYLRGK